MRESRPVLIAPCFLILTLTVCLGAQKPGLRSYLSAEGIVSLVGSEADAATIVGDAFEAFDRSYLRRSMNMTVISD